MNQDEPKRNPEVNPVRLSGEEMAKLLRAREQKRRPHRWVVFLVLLLLFAVPLGLIIWYFLPEPIPPDALIVAFDAVGCPGEAIALVARMERMEGSPDHLPLEGWPVLFAPDKLNPGPEEGLTPLKVRTDAAGTAALEVELKPSLTGFPYVAIYGPDHKQARRTDRASLYCWPKDTPLLIVDAQRSLSQADLDAWGTAGFRDIPRNQEAAEALDTIAREQPYKVVYLAPGTASAEEYLQVRSWLQVMPLEGSKRFPPGPVLGQPGAAEGDSPAPLEKLLRHLTDCFQGKRVGVTSHSKTAAAFREAGLQTFLISKNQEPPPEVTVVEHWEGLIEQLP